MTWMVMVVVKFWSAKLISGIIVDMFDKIIKKWQQRYRQFYAGHLWRSIFDLGLVIIIITLLSLWQLTISHHNWLNTYYDWAIKLPVNKPTIYQTMPLVWQTTFGPKIINDSTKRLIIEVGYENKADQPIQVNYGCRESLSGRQLTIVQPDNPKLVIDDQGVSIDLAAKQSGRFSISLIDFSSRDIDSRQIKIVCDLVAQSELQAWPVVEQEFVFKVAGSVQVTAGAYFYTADGDQVGIGPLPPMVGLPTSYLVTWVLQNSGGDLSDIQFSAELGDEIEWQGEAGLTGGNLVYDPQNNKVNWRMADWPDQIVQKQASFYVSINPTKDMVGKIPTLIKLGQWSVIDNWTGQKWQGQLLPLSTNLDNDSRSQGQGEIRDWLTE